MTNLRGVCPRTLFNKLRFGVWIGVAAVFAKRVRDILKSATPGDEAEISGWVVTIREFPEFAFIELSDGSSLKGLQIIADKNIASYDVVQSLGTGASFTAQGVIKESEGKGQRIELHAQVLTLLGKSAAPGWCG